MDEILGLTIVALFFVVPFNYVFLQLGPIGVGFAIFLDLAMFGFIGLLYEAKRRAGKRMKELERMSTMIKAYDDQNARLIESDQGQPISINLPSKMPRFCPNLVRLSSVLVTCPNCRFTFSRFFGIGKISVMPSELNMLKTGQISITEIIRKKVREQGCPSSFTCPACNRSIVRSREPSGVCKLAGKRVTGEKLFCCTINQCTGPP